MLSDGETMEIALSVRSEEGKRGYAAGMRMAVSLLEDRISGGVGLFVWRSDMKQLAASLRQCVALMSVEALEPKDDPNA